LIAKQSDVKFEHHDDKLNILVYESSNTILSVFLMCTDSDHDKIDGRQDDQDTFDIFLESRCCCPGKCQYSGESIGGGGIFVIILLVLVFVYLVGGMLFLKFARGATGQDMIPNRMLWLNIVSYAIDGLRYSMQVIRQRSFAVDYQKV
jgi:hypothetical protein